MGEAAIPHLSIRYQEGTTIEAEETQRQLDRDSGFTETPVISKYLEELPFVLCIECIHVRVGVGQGLTSDVLLHPSLSNFFETSLK